MISLFRLSIEHPFFCVPISIYSTIITPPDLKREYYEMDNTLSILLLYIFFKKNLFYIYEMQK